MSKSLLFKYWYLQIQRRCIISVVNFHSSPLFQLVLDRKCVCECVLCRVLDSSGRGCGHVGSFDEEIGSYGCHELYTSGKYHLANTAKCNCCSNVTKRSDSLERVWILLSQWRNWITPVIVFEELLPSQIRTDLLSEFHRFPHQVTVLSLQTICYIHFVLEEK